MAANINVDWNELNLKSSDMKKKQVISEVLLIVYRDRLRVLEIHGRVMHPIE